MDHVRDSFQEDEKRDHPAVLPGRDEMNLVEFPFASLRKQGDSRDAFTYEGWITGRDGKRQRQKWVVRGLSGIGLPNEYDERVIVALMAITASQGFEDRKVPFSVYQVLQVMGLTDSKRDYENIERSLERLVGVTIFAEGAFWDNGGKNWVKMKAGFHLIEKFWLRYREEDEQVRAEEGIPGYIVWSQDIWKSIQDGYIKNLDLTFYYALESPLARRLYRFLDKRMCYQSEYEIDVFELAGRLGMTRYRYPSKVVEKLQPAIDDLIARKYLLRADVVKVKKYTRLFFERAPELALVDDTEAPEEVEPVASGPEEVDITDALDHEAVALLTDQGISEREAVRLVTDHGSERVREKIDFLAWQQETDPLAIRSPRGWLRRAIEEDYGPPDGYQTPAQRAHEIAQLTLLDEVGWQSGGELYPERQAILHEQYGTTDREREVWAAVLRDVEGKTTRATFERLFAGTELLQVGEGQVLIGVPNQMVLDWLQHRMGTLIVDAVRDHYGEAVELEFVVLKE